MKKYTLHPMTERINHQQAIRSKAKRQEALLWLKQQFPDAFDNSTRIRPLKIGIMNDIFQYTEQAEKAGISRSKLREAVVLFTRRLDYLTTLKAQEMRIDLHGNPVCLVSPSEAEIAANKIKKHLERKIKKASPFGEENQAMQRKLVTPEQHQFQINPVLAMTPRAEVIIKHKTSRSYDPDAITRIKQQLGLGKK